MIFGFLKRKAPVVSPERSSDREFFTAMTGKDLLKLNNRPMKVVEIKKAVSTTDAAWEEHYLFAIEQFAEIVQGLPASELHHHSRHGGLIDHTVDSLRIAMTVVKGYILPPNADPEMIRERSARWRYGVFIAILAHDLGKVITDIDVVYFQKGGDVGVEQWDPVMGVIPNGARYTYRFSPRNKDPKTAKGMHQVASPMLVNQLMTTEARKWMYEDAELKGQFTHAIAGVDFGGQVISEIIKLSDQGSTAKDVGSFQHDDRSHTLEKPLHEKIIEEIVDIAEYGDFGRNRQGAGIWITEKYTWFTDRRLGEAVAGQLREKGVKGVPSDPRRIIRIIADHGLCLKNDEGEASWRAQLNLPDEDWVQKLTLLKFEHDVVWPRGKPAGRLNGFIKVRNPNGKYEWEDGLKVIEGKLAHDDIEEAGITDKSDESSLDLTEAAKHEVEGKDDSDTDSNVNHVTESIYVRKKKVTGQAAKKGRSTKQSKKKNIKREETVSNGMKKIGRETEVTESTLMKDEFISWLITGIKSHKIRVNESKAEVHVLKEYICLVSPKVFVQYLRDNPLKAQRLEDVSRGKESYVVVQNNLQKLNINQVGPNGQNIVTLMVNGRKDQKNLSVYLLKRRYFPSLGNFSTNRNVSIML